jgi:hypothetical protein
VTAKKGSGFAPPNYTQTPNTLFDLLPVISNAELRVTLALVRETHGWHRQRTDMLSVPELAALAGLSASSAKTGIAEALKRGTLKRFKTRDSQNRPTYKYGLVIRDDVPREEFERPKKQQENAAQDDAQGNPSGQNLTGSEIDRVPGSSGQILTGSPEDSSGQNLTGSYKEERKSFEVKKVVEENADLDAGETESEHDDDEPLEDQENQTPFGGEQQAHTPASAHEDGAAGPDLGEDAEGGEDVPPAAAPAWNPAEVNHEISALTNKRWMRKWQPRGSKDWNDPLIEEVDGSGVDRRRIAYMVSPDQLAGIVETLRAERSRLTTAAATDASVKVYTFQHMLIQALQETVIRVDELHRQAQAFGQGQDIDAPPAPASAGHDWQVGDTVIFQRCRYQVERITDTYLDLYDDENGSVKVVRNTRDYDSLKFVPAAQAAS